MFPKIGVKDPKMDGFISWKKTYVLMDDLGVFPLFVETQT